MKPESMALLTKSQEFMEKAQRMLDVHQWHDEAGRAAYLAGFARGASIIFEMTGQAIKRHAGGQREFARLVKDDPRFDTDLRPFLPRAYNLKAIAGYATGPSAHVSPETASAAGRFANGIVGLLPD